ncbi:MAG: hypothetical protein EOO92_22385 [Pedobacter sp.]|nr:MAG: hypothetical protein EOO92_22385 [Pedobacter sp.]
MQLAVYVFYELLIRLQELDPAVGEYSSFKKTDEGVTLNTTTGSMEVLEHLLSMQFNTPALITSAELLNILKTFRLHS